ncbi:MAG: hypothetical protein NC453_14670 [Muribaculum sp.]|nr:hypothetical protein [Muribaculum sp.]
METINVLWTGGLDSTFRVCELSRIPVIIQPYYMIDEHRTGSHYELKAIKDITKMLESFPTTKAKIQNVITIKKTDIEISDSIHKSYQYLQEKYLLGSQYEYFAGWTNKIGIDLEVGIESSPRSKAHNALSNESLLITERYVSSNKSNDYDWGGYLKIDPSKSNPEIVDIFKNLRLPQNLFNIEKLEEVRLLKQWGMEACMKKTWFCHAPVMGLPCGHCNPCKDALNEGLAWRVPKVGRFLGTLRTIILLPENTARKIYWKLKQL